MTNSRTQHRRAAAALACAAALTLSACGGSDDDAGTATGGTTPTVEEDAPPTSAETTETETTETETDEAGAQEVTIAAVDFDYELPTTEFSAGELTIELVNEGEASHNIVVEQDGEDIASTDVINSGETATLTVDLEPGEYVFYCSVANHRALGMEVQVTVI
ncbi:plastocyanin/azurin family copper-binding protein [Blastococcus sp. BMG 814]|uniref:Plastocyanin/azurin family copper-binding protein n=1 Tax=Blastococcus carthaginiensis TaxID=3050034 RepID=A0ABT9ID73_9ACTN|nr:plastocyanin/azurin family copper-binding protein [Blastococcus carthaginiensis]MDP5183533.1 plastocyanin/azurin family copper-binding protein [Blastococcus carthaginiensis]